MIKFNFVAGASISKFSHSCFRYVQHWLGFALPRSYVKHPSSIKNLIDAYRIINLVRSQIFQKRTSLTP